MKSFKENLAILKRAQEVDAQLYQAAEALKAIPLEREKNQNAFQAEKARLHELEEQLKKLQLQQKGKEGQLQEKESHIRKLDGQLSQVKTNKEYTAIQQEIASLKADNSLIEEEVIRILDEVEAAHEEVKKEKDRLKDQESIYQGKLKEIEQTEKVLKQNHDGFQQQRAEVLTHLDPEVKDRYLRIVEKKHGLALVQIQGEICGGCRIQLRPQVLNEIYQGETMILCDNCSRILYSDKA